MSRMHESPRKEKRSKTWLHFFLRLNVFHINYHALESESEIAQSSPTLCDPMDCSLPGSFIHGIFQARVLEWVAISFRRSSQPRD